jgi:hypothetical protein
MINYTVTNTLMLLFILALKMEDHVYFESMDTVRPKA